MQGDVVAAARWLGASLVVSSLIVVGGWRRTIRGVEPGPDVAHPSPTGRDARVDAEVARTSAEAPRPDDGITRCVSLPGAERVPILDPVPGDSGASCLDRPSEDEVWDKVGESQRRSPFFWAQRDKVKIHVEKIGEKVDPCKVYPLAGPCELVHCHYKCTAEFDEPADLAGAAVPTASVKHRVEVVYIDKDHLRRCPGPGAGAKDAK